MKILKAIHSQYIKSVLFFTRFILHSYEIGRAGNAITFIGENDVRLIHNIEEKTGKTNRLHFFYVCITVHISSNIFGDRFSWYC